MTRRPRRRCALLGLLLLAGCGKPSLEASAPSCGLLSGLWTAQLSPEDRGDGSRGPDVLSVTSGGGLFSIHDLSDPGEITDAWASFGPCSLSFMTAGTTSSSTWEMQRTYAVDGSAVTGSVLSTTTTLAGSLSIDWTARGSIQH